MINKWDKILYQGGKFACGVFIDLQKAFDTVDTFSTVHHFAPFLDIKINLLCIEKILKTN